MNIQTSEFTKSFEIAIQLGAIMAVVVLYFKRFLQFDLYPKLAIAFIPTALVGFLLYPLVKGFLLGSVFVTLVALFVGGIVLILFRKEGQQVKIGLKQAFLIGAFQSISVIPGVSRAASTIIGGLLVGLNKKTATEFSFILAVPTMFAATGYDLYKSADQFSSADFRTLTIGFALSFSFAFFAVKFLISYIQSHDFRAFGFYRIILAAMYWFIIA